jgi:signal transduction histidine kinase
MILLNEQLINKEQELSETNTKLESSLKERDKFFSIIAHDLRGPIGSFLGLTKMVTEQSSEFTKEELLEISDMLYKSADTLYNLMENLLNWSRLQRDVIIVEPIPIKVESVINLSLSIYNDAINKKNIEVSKHILKDISALSDLNMLQSVIRNLLSNAIKFTPLNGKIIIESKKIDANLVSIAIQDSGIGMSEDLVSKLFKIDEKVSREGTEGEPSTGLGLILCKEFVEKNKGSISVVSQENKGTKFEIILPIGIEE